MPGITVVPRDPHFISAFDEAYRSQLPFATSRALNTVLFDARRSVQKQAKRHWNVRQRGLLKTLRVLKTHKRDWPKLEGGVYVAEDVGRLFQEHEHGIIRKPTSGHLAVPSRRFARFRLKSGKQAGRFKDEHSPRGLISSGRARVTERGIELKKVTKKNRLRIAFFTIEQARIKPGLGATKAGHGTVRSKFQEYFEVEMKAAIKSRRAQPGRLSSELGRGLWVKARRQYGRIPGF